MGAVVGGEDEGPRLEGPGVALGLPAAQSFGDGKAGGERLVPAAPGPPGEQAEQGDPQGGGEELGRGPHGHSSLRARAGEVRAIFQAG